MQGLPKSPNFKSGGEIKGEEWDMRGSMKNIVNKNAP
jgi:hypothetical protein